LIAPPVRPLPVVRPEIIIHSDTDAVLPRGEVTTPIEKLRVQKGIIIEQKVIPGANHFFDGKIEPLMSSISGYLDKRLGTKSTKATTAA
jgi:alpha/beta superfamily hydrolase